MMSFQLTQYLEFTISQFRNINANLSVKKKERAIIGKLKV